METVLVDVKDVNGCKNMPIDTLDSEKVENHSDEGEESESISLLPPMRDGMSRKCEKARRKVQWNDRNGNKLVEVLEFEPSEASDFEDDDSDNCMCTIM